MHGGTMVSNQNINVLKRIFGNDVTVYNVYYYSSRLKSFLYSLWGYITGLTPCIEKNIKKLVLLSNFDYIFLNTSRFGNLTKMLHTLPIKIITFFHNIEITYHEYYFKNSGILLKLLFYPTKLTILKSEKNIIRYSDKIIVLNQRDSLGLQKIYHRKADIIFPLTLDDCYDKSIAEKHNKNSTKNMLLFVGSDFFGNTEGLFWFIKNCLDKINAELLVVGSGMDKYFNKYSEKNLSFIGYTENIDTYYYQSDAVVLPILSGSGMKTKTCEALMYGKTIFGTNEAFEGYDTLNIIGNNWLCNTVDEFITKINDYLSKEHSKINEYSRMIFMNNYSTAVLEKKMYDFLKK
jgi:hypothetical protein